MTSPDPKNDDKRWAPWWIYVIAVILLNLLKQQFMEGVPVAVNVAITVVVAGLAIGAVTWVWRRFAARERR